MNHYVPDFDPNADYSLHSSSEQNRHRKSSMPDDEIIELLWQNGQLVMQSQNQRSVFRKSQPSKLNSTIPADHSAATEMRALQQQEPEEQHLFMQEDEMASWLHYPLVEDASLDNNFCSELLYPTPPQCLSQNNNPSLAVRSSRVIEHRPPTTLNTVETTVTEVTPRPPIPSIRSIEPENKVHNFPLFSSHKPRANTTGPSSSKSVAMESTMVGSNDTPAVEPISPAYEMERRSTRDAANRDFGCRMINSGGVAGTSSSGGGGIGMTAYELSLTSSSGISRTSTEPTSQTQTQTQTQTRTQAAEGRKRKANETEATEFQNEGADFDFGDAKKQGRGMASTNKRARAAEVHNLSERRRRDRINEKMKALQELIPRCNKTDKASMLDEAIDYLKSLQLQVQMMSMGCGMMPMMYPGVQHFMPNMGMGLGMGMGIGMGMDMSINRPMMPYPNMFAGSALPRPSAASQLGPGYPMPPFPMHPVPNSDPYRIQHPNQSDHMLNSVRSQGINQPGVSTFVNSYQQFSGPSQMQLHHPQSAPQNQPEPSSRNQCSVKGSDVISNYPSG